jgi:L-malate glycosyltransferase
MRVLFVLEDLLTGGAQVHTLDLAARLARRGFRPELAILGAQVAPAMAARTDLPVTVLRQRGLRRPSEWVRLGRALGAREPDLVVAVNQVAGCVTAAARAAGQVRAPVLSVLHATAVRTWAGRARSAAFVLAARAHVATIFVSERQRAHWSRRGMAAWRAPVIRHGVALAPSLPPGPGARAVAKARLGLDPRRPVVGTVAMFRREKNLHQVVAAAAALRDRGREVQFLLVGDGPEREAVQARAAALGLAHVRFTGEQPLVGPFLQAMDVGLLCSKEVETLPLFGLELMATGAPLVAPRLGGLEELVTDGADGFLFRPGDTADLLRGLEAALVPARHDRLAAGARAKAAQFCPEGMADRYADLFRRTGRSG